MMNGLIGYIRRCASMQRCNFTRCYHVDTQQVLVCDNTPDAPNSSRDRWYRYKIQSHDQTCNCPVLARVVHLSPTAVHPGVMRPHDHDHMHVYHVVQHDWASDHSLNVQAL